MPDLNDWQDTSQLTTVTGQGCINPQLAIADRENAILLRDCLAETLEKCEDLLERIRILEASGGGGSSGSGATIPKGPPTNPNSWSMDTTPFNNCTSTVEWNVEAIGTSGDGSAGQFAQLTGTVALFCDSGAGPVQIDSQPISDVQGSLAGNNVPVNLSDSGSFTGVSCDGVLTVQISTGGSGTGGVPITRTVCGFSVCDEP